MTLPFLVAATVPPFLAESAALLVCGAAIAYLSYRLGLVPIVGFLVAGVVIGPHALGLVRDQALVDAAAEVGVILLLFTIGIEFSLEKLARIRTLIVGGGTLQVGLASAAVAGLLALGGVDWRAGLFTGFLVALSSTAIVLKLLGDRGETGTPYGQVSLGLLIFQDLAIIVMVLLVPMLAGRGGSAVGLAQALGTAGALIVVVLVVARRVMPPLLERVARTCSPELFLLTVAAICFGTAYLTSLAGVSVSLGAFLAGLVVSESKFSQQAFSEILPLQILFSATFFVSVGMLLDVGFLLRHLPLVLAAVVAVAVLKLATTAVAVRALGYPLPVAVASGLTLAQVGEFSFVLERAGRELGLTPAGLGVDGSQTFIAATVLLMVATPVLTRWGSDLAARLDRRRTTIAAGHDEDAAAHPAPALDLANHVIVAGYGQAAHQLVRVLAGSGVPFVITTLSPGGAAEADAEGLPVIRGDASRQVILQHAGIARAKMVVIADDDPATAHRIAAVARPLAPTARIVVRTRYVAEVEVLAHGGVDRVVAEELESIVQLFADVLRNYEIPAAEIQAHEDAVRRGGYAVLRAEEQSPREPPVVCNLDGRCFATRHVTLRAGMPVAGRTIAEIAWADRGLTLVALRRGARAIGDPGPGERLAAGDELEITGSAEAFAAAAPLFQPGPAAAAALPAPEPVMSRIDTHTPIRIAPRQTRGCSHLDRTTAVYPSATGCEDCLKIGATWVHLRICMTCGHVGCCDSSRHKHATAHFQTTRHPIVRSLEPGERWAWCYEDEEVLE